MSENGMFGGKGSGDTSGFGGLVNSATVIASTQRPYGGYFDQVADDLERAYPLFSDAIEKAVVDRGELTLFIKAARLVDVAKILRDQLRFEMCVGVNGIHFPEETTRELHAVYSLLSITRNQRIRLEVCVSEKDPHIPSVVDVWAGANWHERETYDMFGIIFDNHPGLTRILMPDDWAGFPQRKDYPLGGIEIEYKGATVPAPSQRRSYK
ncbi:NADH-quinone oxidoreductase subunit C [Candidatus Nanopelagicus limnes]|jgi:NADH-quinone oxidoreductase subunit C|uniref:NADH-quinone oxidoreductase subunit C n=1 Tax=Candidatus Nanopelagicus limnae TaxID=1884634 RepID=A0A249JWH3_9ACTN|nr:NADH-quinone oxidoreductase subunit C [Candidatus Nanopelagicus limnes]ASY08874.1 NADH-quinone oxidoreductase subunit C [Candidatus Nanopelagicus limnes]